ncbi:MAG: hypothetical protein QOH54_1689, partial [Mycobacterium sp.]|nr:hypothetical protein [Mycobacterium sp.]
CRITSRHRYEIDGHCRSGYMTSPSYVLTAKPVSG